MALKGTLKDFGIADIFQLISHQNKTGILHLQSKEHEVRIFFVNGDVVKAETPTRKKEDRLGALLVRAGIVDQSSVEEALEVQSQTLKKLGAILVEQKRISEKDLMEMTRLQTMETLYRLFNWENGTYGFQPQEVLTEADFIAPIRSENVLMEGFRMVDEWPMVRKKITSYEMTFNKLKDIDPTLFESREEDLDSSLDEAFGEAGPKKKGPKNIGLNEYKVFQLLEGGRTVQRLIDFSRLGEFETCKALYNLLSEGYIKLDTVVAPAQERPGGKPGERIGRFDLGRLLVQGGMYALIVIVLTTVWWLVEFDMFTLVDKAGALAFQNPLARELVGSAQKQRLDTALEVYRLEMGHYPEKLEDLVQVGLVEERELRFPWRNPYPYQRRDGGYLLVRPFE